MKARSKEKIKQVMDLMNSLHLRQEARERLTPGGFLEKTVFWIDDEQYPQPVKEVPAGEVPPEGHA